MGLHEEAAELGHEEIRLNLGDEPEAEHETPHSGDNAPTHESKPI
jgi:hypothetical protein